MYFTWVWLIRGDTIQHTVQCGTFTTALTVRIDTEIQKIKDFITGISLTLICNLFQIWQLVTDCLHLDLWCVFFFFFLLFIMIILTLCFYHFHFLSTTVLQMLYFFYSTALVYSLRCRLHAASEILNQSLDKKWQWFISSERGWIWDPIIDY